MQDSSRGRGKHAQECPELRKPAIPSSTVGRGQKVGRPKRPSAGEGRPRMWEAQATEHYSAMKRGEALTPATV